MSAKFAWILLIALSISTLILAGCNSDDEDTSPTGPGTSNTGTTGTTGTIDASNVGAVQTPIVIAVTKAIVQGEGTYNGAKSGTMTVTRTAVSVTGLSYNAVFASYTDDGLLFIDGPLVISITLATQSTKITGELTTSGTLSAKVGLDLTSANGVTTGTITVDGQKISIPVSG